MRSVGEKLRLARAPHRAAATGCAQPRNEIGKKRRITFAALRMILDSQRERIIAQPHLLDDVVGLAPGLDFEAVAESIDGLVMGAVHLLEPMRCGTIGPQRLDVMILHLRRVVPRNVEVQRSAERDVKELHAFADGENRQAPFERLFCRLKFPLVPLRLDILVEDGWIGHRLPEKFLRHIRSAASGAGPPSFRRALPGCVRSRAARRDVSRKRGETISRPSGESRWPHSAWPTLRPFISVVNSSPAHHGRERKKRGAPASLRRHHERKQGRGLRRRLARLRDRLSLCDKRRPPLPRRQHHESGGPSRGRPRDR